MLLVFQEDVFWDLQLCKLPLKQGGHADHFSGRFFYAVLFRLRDFLLKRGRNAAHFSGRISGLRLCNRDFAIVVHEQGEMLPVFLEEFWGLFENKVECCPFSWSFLVPFDFHYFASKEEEMLPIFREGVFRLITHAIFFPTRNQEKRLPIFLQQWVGL